MNTIKTLCYVSLLFFVLMTSCQKEEINITNPENESIIKSNSTTASLMSRTAINDGSFDNIIDKANCLEVVLPVTVTANGITITIESIADFDALEAILDEVLDDVDKVDISFPITVVLADYTEMVLNNQEELTKAIGTCKGEDEKDDDIECIDFKYPISFSMYNTDFQVIDTKTITSDEELHKFIASLTDSTLASLNFPINLIDSNGVIKDVSDNKALEDALSSADEACDEDDDYDYNDDDVCSIEEVQENLKSCHWKAISYNGDNHLEDYILYFKEDQRFFEETGQVEAVWTISNNSDDKVAIEISQLVGGNLEDLNGNWVVTVCEDEKIVLKNSDTNVELILNSGCVDNVETCLKEAVQEKLNSCHWKAVSYNGDNHLEDYILYFKEDQRFFEETEQVEAVWTISNNSDNKVAIEISQLAGGNLEDLNGNWVVIACEDKKLTLKNSDNDVELILVKGETCP